MKNITSILYKGVLGALVTFSMTSCEDYLEKEPDTDISETEAFKNFTNFQGFVEQNYGNIPDKESCNWCPSWNWGDDEIFNPEADSRLTHQMDIGNFKAWTTTGNWLYKNDNNLTDYGNTFAHSLYPSMWYCIHVCNVGIHQLTEENNFLGSEEEKNLLLGQLYFFRAWWHFEMINYLGGLPYIDRDLSQEKVVDEERLSYLDCAKKCAEDFKRAADLLPVNWDETTTGTATKGKNEIRINKIMALGYLGKCYLYAGSPLSINGAQVGGSHTYDYDSELCKQAAETFGQILTMVENNSCQYSLVSFEHTDIYNHKNGENIMEYSQLFYTMKASGRLPGLTEVIFGGPSYSGDFNYSNWNNSKVWGPKNEKIVEHDNVIHQPTANYVENYGMANGLPLHDPESGFDPRHPWKDRDPRFYHDIVFDGFQYVNGSMNNEAQEYLRYCSLYTGGDMRSVTIASRTGYFTQKLVPHTCNAIDGDYNWGSSLQTHLSYMRLADIYLMYAEAGAAIQGSSYKSTNCSLTALDAINKIRKRCGAGEVAEKFVSDQHKFMDEIRRERAVELSFEGHRFCDLQRWLLLTEKPYTQKYSVEFDRVYNGNKVDISTKLGKAKSEEMDMFYRNDKKDPKDAEVANYRLVEILTRNYDARHYWFPIPIDQTYYSSKFQQNPGW
ncbi:MAG: RagB/SusD family nutrient uptake outer membrane protein [Bacteroidales bacterium]|nr:RagB/SusD family nutrient uptake outer membrane protein [Bacteroidales bacterium]